MSIFQKAVDHWRHGWRHRICTSQQVEARRPCEGADLQLRPETKSVGTGERGDEPGKISSRSSEIANEPAETRGS